MSRRSIIERIICVAGFVIGLAGVIVAVVTYGWRAAAIDHWWYAIAYLLLISSLWFGRIRGVV